MSDILNKICAVKVEEVAAALANQSLASVRRNAEAQPGARDFVAAIRSVKMRRPQLRASQRKRRAVTTNRIGWPPIGKSPSLR